jgi:transcriptional regulator with XRE-family HTH domain
MREYVDVYQRVLGDEIRRLRKKRGWTRKDLNDRLRSQITVQTLATYELGTRQCSVLRLVEICLALVEYPHELLARVHGRVFVDARIGLIRIDLRTLVCDNQPELSPLRRWARGQLEKNEAQACLTVVALERMAELCDLDIPDLVERLRCLGGEATIGSGRRG